MRGLLLGVLVGFSAVTLLMVWRWSGAQTAEVGPPPVEPQRVAEPDWPRGIERAAVQYGAGASPKEDLAKEGTARKDFPSVSGDSYGGAESASQGLRMALTLGFEREEALALAQGQDPAALQTFFAEHTHIDADWLHRTGLSPEILPELYARWAAGAWERERTSAPGDVLLSRFSPASDGGPYRAQHSFQSQDRAVFLHYSLPEHYQPDAVLVRWVREPADGRQPTDALQHFDRHHLTGDPQLRQEAWMRPAEGWDPGDYRVEIFSADAELQLLASQSYRVD